MQIDLSKITENRHLSKYKIESRPEWVYQSPDDQYRTQYVIIEDQIIFEQAIGTPSLDDTKKAIKIILDIIENEFEDSKPHMVSDARKIRGSSAEVRKYVAEFNKDTTRFASNSIIASTLTKALFGMVKALLPSGFRHWKVYRNEEYCIDEILKGEVILGQSQHSSEYELIYKALIDLGSDNFSYKNLINEAKSNQELTSVITALQIINDEKKLADNQLDLNFDIQNGDIKATSILFKSILENTATIVALMDERFKIINTNKNFEDYFNNHETKGSPISEFVSIGQKQLNNVQEKNHTHFISNKDLKTLSCKLFKINNLNSKTYIIFIGEDITEKESLKASEKKLLDELKDQNLKLLKVNHLLSHEINHQIASLSQILEELRTTVSEGSHLEPMISEVKDELNVSLGRINKTLFETDNLKLQSDIEELTVITQKQLKVMLVDDDNITNMFNERIVKKSFPSFEINVQTDASQALDIIKSYHYKPDIVLLDLNMPIFNGFDFLKSISAINLESIPVIFVVSSSRDPKEIDRANSYKVVAGYHAKPLTKEKVKGLVNTYQIMEEKLVDTK